MPALIATRITGTITWIGRVADRGMALASVPVAEAALRFGGLDGEDHGGLTRPSCSRVMALHPRGSTIANTRQLSVLGADDLAAIAGAMGLSALDPALLGASLVIGGIPDFSHLPPSSRVQAAGGATLVVDMENRPCTLPGPVIEAAHPGFGARFKPAAEGRRGITAWVEREGMLRLGATVRLFVPDQPAWQGHVPVPAAASVRR